MGFLQTVGIASQASDGYDRLRQGDRMRTQQEFAGQQALDDDQLYRQIVKMAYAHEFEKEQAKKKPKAAVPAIAAPVAPGTGLGNDDMMLLRGADTGGFAMADGGAISAPAQAEKFNGIYDDMKVTDRMPTIFTEFIQDMQTPGFKHGGMVGKTIGEMANHCKAMADGGEVTNGVGTPVGFKHGGSVYEFVKHHVAKKPKAVKLRGGGPVHGPGTGTSDSVPAVGPGGRPFLLSNNEYVLPADTVQAVGGVAVLDALRDATHTPVR